MANRSYLYSLNVIPSPDQPRKLTVKDVAEYKWHVPLSFLVLVSGDPVAVRSLIWDIEPKSAIVGKYETGLTNFERFVTYLESQEGIDKAEVRKQSENILKFLHDPKVKQNYFILELGEIFDLVGELNEQATQHYLDRARSIMRSIEASERLSKWEDIGLDAYWSFVLYFHARNVTPSAIIPKTKEQWLDVGIAHFKAKRYAEAIAAYTHAIELDPNDASAYHNRALALNPDNNEVHESKERVQQKLNQQTSL